MTDCPALLSRVADSVHWMARYIERAENIARFMAVNLHLQLDLPLNAAQQWQPLIETSGGGELFCERYGEATQANVIQFLTMDTGNPNSIYCCLRSARENARSVRETISSEMWEQVNGMYLQMIRAQQALQSPETVSDVLREIRLGCHLFSGITNSTMSHNEAWHFVRLGGSLERADKISRILDVKYFILLPSVTAVGSPYDDLHWAAVLKSVSGFEMYRKRYGQIFPTNIVEFLVLDREFPRAVHHCIGTADRSLHAITGTRPGSFSCHSEQLMGMLNSELSFTSVSDIIGSGLHEYLDGLQIKINGIGEAVFREFFNWRCQAQTTSVIAGES